MTYGVPYSGSKNSIAAEIVSFLPEADAFYDLFAGGCAVSHAAAASGRYKKIIINDINPMPTQLFMDALAGKYKNEKRWISHEDFFKLKDTDPYVKYCWSFGNNGKSYLYGNDIEEFKHGLHLAVYEKDARLLEKELGVKTGTMPRFDKINDAQERYLAYKKLLKSMRGGVFPPAKL